MAVCSALDDIISSVRYSNLNFAYQETPFSLYLTIRKTKIKKEHSSLGLQSSQKIVRQDDVVALELENLSLKRHISDLEGKFSAAKDTTKKLEEIVAASEAEALKVCEHIEKQNKTLAKKEDELVYLKNLNKTYNATIARLESEKIELNKTIENKEKSCQNTVKKLKEEVKIYKEGKNELEKKTEQLEKKIKEAKKSSDNTNEQLDVKDKLFKELAKKNEDLEEKVNSLLDLLYGCNACGRFGEFCECDDIEGDDAELSASEQQVLRQPSPAPPTVTSVTPHVPPPCSTSPPWTPPPTPPCSSCGGVNFGPCPTSVCFMCIPPLTIPNTQPCSNSPSTTPPGTPPSIRGTHHQSLY